MKSSSILIIHTALLFSRLSIAGYVLQDAYIPDNFLDGFNAFSSKDPTDGFVKYQDMESGKNLGLIKRMPASILLGVDTKNVTPDGRPSVRLESKKSYDSGLIIADISHMPGSICGSWPAFWTVGPQWPNK
jgi:hypothetical protein